MNELFATKVKSEDSAHTHTQIWAAYAFQRGLFYGGGVVPERRSIRSFISAPDISALKYDFHDTNEYRMENKYCRAFFRLYSFAIPACGIVWPTWLPNRRSIHINICRVCVSTVWYIGSTIERAPSFAQKYSAQRRVGKYFGTEFKFIGRVTTTTIIDDDGCTYDPLRTSARTRGWAKVRSAEKDQGTTERERKKTQRSNKKNRMSGSIE